MSSSEWPRYKCCHIAEWSRWDHSSGSDFSTSSLWSKSVVVQSLFAFTSVRRSRTLEVSNDPDHLCLPLAEFISNGLQNTTFLSYKLFYIFNLISKDCFLYSLPAPLRHILSITFLNRAHFSHTSHIPKGQEVGIRIACFFIASWSIPSLMGKKQKPNPTSRRFCCVRGLTLRVSCWPADHPTGTLTLGEWNMHVDKLSTRVAF